MALDAHLGTLDALRRQGVVAAQRALPELEALLSRADVVARALEAVEQGSATRVGVSIGEVFALGRELGAFGERYFPELDFPPDLFLDVRDAQRALLSLRTLRRLFVGAQSATSGEASPVPAATGPVVPYLLRQGDTLERLALAFLGDASRWVELAELNGLEYPFVETALDYQPGEFSYEYNPAEYRVYPFAAHVGPTVRATGEVLFFPADARIPRASETTTPADVELYGRDFKVDQGVIVLTTDGEAETVEGVPNVVQALRQRLGSVVGDLVLHPTYGVEHLLVVGIEGTEANLQLGALSIGRAVRNDPRVTRVEDLALLFRDTVEHLGVRVGLIGPLERSVPLNAVIPETGVVMG